MHHIQCIHGIVYLYDVVSFGIIFEYRPCQNTVISYLIS